MAYVPIDPALIVVGEPTKKEIFDRIRENQESFNGDIEALKQTSTISVFDVRFIGDLNSFPQTFNQRMPVSKAPGGYQFTSVVITLLEPSVSGQIEMNIEKSTDGGVNWSQLLSSPVVLDGLTVGSISGAVNWVDSPSQFVAQNDLVRVQFSALQAGQGSFHVSVYGEVA